MATRTLQLASFEGGSIRAEMDINDANWRPSKVRVINNSNHPLYIKIRESGTIVWENTAPGGQESSWNITGIQLGWQEDYWNSDKQEYEAAGLDLGNYTIEAGN